MTLRTKGERKPILTKRVIMPALGMAQETGVVLRWLKSEGEPVAQGEPLLEIETDKATVEIEAPASGILASLSAQAGDEVPVGEVIALILEPGESVPDQPASAPEASPAPAVSQPPAAARPPASPVAARIAAEHHVDLDQVKPEGSRIQKEDVLAYIKLQGQPPALSGGRGKVPASPKARRLAAERGIDLVAIQGSGPEQAVLAADVQAMKGPSPTPEPAPALEPRTLTPSPTWRTMAERVTHSWTSVPHFYLLRDVNVNRLISWREKAQERLAEKITYTDLLTKLVAIVLREHPQLNARWQNGAVLLDDQINIGLAVAIQEGLVVPVIHQADTLSLSEIATRRQDLIARAQAGRLRPEHMRGGTFTISNLGMYGVDSFSAILNPPQAAILAVGRIVERAVPVGGRPAIQPMATLSLTCDHRVVDGAHGAQFLGALTELIEEPLILL